MSTKLGEILDRAKTRTATTTKELPCLSRATIGKYAIFPDKPGRQPIATKAVQIPPETRKEKMAIEWLPFKKFAVKTRMLNCLPLSKRQMDIVKLIAFYDKFIAETLGINIKTVESQKDRIYAKINVRSKVELVIFLLQNGLVDVNMFKLPTYERPKSFYN